MRASATVVRPSHRTSAVAALGVLACVLALVTVLLAQRPAVAAFNAAADYYGPVDGLSGAALKSGLHDLVDDHRELTDDEVWDGISDVDEDPRNTSDVVLLYTGRSQAKSDHGGGADQWNREHTWA